MTRIRNLQHNQPTRLHNIKCAYCNIEFTKEERVEKEHVIGKNFVPRGSHEQQWNLHLNSCHTCNQEKSKLENDISAITMIQPLSSGDKIDETLEAEAQRKGSKSFSQRTGKPVSISTEKVSITQQFGNAIMTFGFTAPPQVDEKRIFSLARYQLAGLFFLMTYKEKECSGYYWPGVFMPINVLRKQDWGNPQKASFTSATADWQFRFGGGALANGYFQALIKKHPKEPLWSWALEWNKTHRLYGFFGDEKFAAKIIKKFDFPLVNRPIIDGKVKYFAREETPLPSNKDDMFFAYTD